MESTAKLKFARVSAQKARLVANLVRGKDVAEAIEVLSFTNKKSAPIIRKLVESAVANAEYKSEASGSDLDVDDLYVETITVDAGPGLRRFRPRARGRATRIMKKTSHITVVLGAR
jgi:large subunit ribosomal protein L22